MTAGAGLALVVVGGAVGAVLRHVLDRMVTARTAGDLPLGILVANLAGSFLIGLVSPLASPGWSLLLAVGLCGALTTYSTMAAGVWGFVERRRFVRAFLVLAATVLGSLLAVSSGLACASLVR